jgi:hypothetical protein
MAVHGFAMSVDAFDVESSPESAEQLSQHKDHLLE